jgi:hypothetical protein
MRAHQALAWLPFTLLCVGLLVGLGVWRNLASLELLDAVREGKVDAARSLLASGASPNARDYMGISVLYTAACSGNSEWSVSFWRRERTRPGPAAG